MATPTVQSASSSIPSESGAESILPYTKGLIGVNLWINNVTGWTLFGALALLAVIVLLIRTVYFANDHLRLLITSHLDEKQQQYWAEDTSKWAILKKHLWTAPLFRKRHNREIQLSRATSAGTLPSRLHTVFLLFYLLTNIAYCCILDYKNRTLPSLRAEARGRTGHLVVINMVPLFLFAGRNNPLIPILGISFDTFNLFHRWIGRIVVLEAVAHVFIWGVNEHLLGGLDAINTSLRTDRFLQYGLASAIAITLILLQTPSPIRHAFYESFLHLHQFLAATMFVGVLLHVENQALPQKPYLYFLIGLWFTERTLRILRIIYYNLSRHGHTTVQITALEGGACRATFYIRRRWTTTPGCHIFAYIPSIALHTSHPFSVAWSDTCPTDSLSRSSAFDDEKSTNTPNAEDDFAPTPIPKTASISCIISTRTGMTLSLYNRAKASPNHSLTLTAFIEGPYGGVRSLRSYGTVLLFAGGVGITHQVSHLKDLVTAFGTGLCSTRKVVLVWTVRSVEQLKWAKSWLDDLKSMPHYGNSVKYMLYVSKPPKLVEGREARLGPFCGEEIFTGRPNVETLIERIVRGRVGAMAVGVCGPGALADDVRKGARGVMVGCKVDFWEEAFTW